MIPFVHVGDTIFRIDEVSNVIRLYDVHAGEDGKVETVQAVITLTTGEVLTIGDNDAAKKAWDIMVQICKHEDWKKQ